MRRIRKGRSDELDNKWGMALQYSNALPQAADLPPHFLRESRLQAIIDTKSYLGFRGHRLRHAPGLDILGQLVFAALNFVPWLADTVWAESGLPAHTRPGFAEWMRMARAPAEVVAGPDGVLAQFRPESGWPQRTLRLGVVRQPPLPGFARPGVPIDAQLAA
jgi:hypothetical protein